MNTSQARNAANIAGNTQTQNWVPVAYTTTGKPINDVLGRKLAKIDMQTGKVAIFWPLCVKFYAQ